MASQEVSPPNIGAIDEVAPVLASLPEIRCETPESKLPTEVLCHESLIPAPSSVPEVPVPSQISKSTLNLALDLVLNEIALQARMTTTATGAMIGLGRSGVLECAAMTGASAPEVAACLNLRPGIAADCFHSGTVGRADDIAADTQADLVAYRRSGLRSILVVPVADEKGQALGILEIFSPRANAFCDRDVLTLQALARRIAANVELVLKNATASSTEVKMIRSQPMPDNGKSELQKSDQRIRASRPRSFSTMTKFRIGVLPVVRKAALVVVCLFAVFRAGRLAWMQATNKHLFSDHPASVEANISGQPQTNKPVSSISPNQVEDAIDVYVRPETVPTKVSRSRVTRPNAVSSIAIDRKPISKTVSAGVGGNPKSGDNEPLLNEEASVPDQRPTSSKSGPQAAKSHDSTASLLLTPSANATAGSSGIEVVPTETAMRMLVQRVEPEYPNVARRQHIQGTVMLDVMINAEGGVDAVTPISGESQLTSAAITAVQQWRFQPLLKSGKPKSFKSRIAIDFTLASSSPQGL